MTRKLSICIESCRLVDLMFVNEKTSRINNTLFYVRVPPSNVQLSAPEKPQLDKPVNMSCHASGQPAPTYTWFKDGEPIEFIEVSTLLKASGKFDDDSPTAKYRAWVKFKMNG